MKGLVIGLAAGMAAGAFISANFSEVRKLAKKAGEAVGIKHEKQNASGESPGHSECECGEDCGCGMQCNCDDSEDCG